MESKEGMKSGVTVTASEAPSTYQVAPNIDNAIPYGVPVTQMPPPLTVVVAAAQAITPSTFSTEKNKRGRPRKLDGAGPSTGTLPPRPLSVIRPPASGNNLGNWGSFASGVGFLPHMMTVNAGEDVATKIASLSQEGPRAICVMSAYGVISNVTIRHSTSSWASLTYEGRFQILSLHGSCVPTEFGGSWGRNGGLSISLATSDGHVVAGVLAGVLIAADPVEVVVGSFLAGSQEVKLPRKRRGKNKVVVADTTSSPASTSHASKGGEQNIGSTSTAPVNPPQVSSLPPEIGTSASTMTSLSLGRETN